MKNFTSFDYKQYRNNLAYSLQKDKKGDREMVKNNLKEEKTTIEYQVSKNIKNSVHKEVKNILSQKNKLQIIKEENEYIDNIYNLADRIIKDYDYTLFHELPYEIKTNHLFILKLLHFEDFYYENLVPKKLLDSKEFMIKAIKIRTDMVLRLTKESKLYNDSDIKEIVKKNDELFSEDLTRAMGWN